MYVSTNCIDLSSQQLVLLLIEELLDSQSISGCRLVFSYLESRREAIIAVCCLTSYPCVYLTK